MVLTTSGWSAATGVPNADTKRPMAGTRASIGPRSAARPPCSPNHSSLVVPSRRRGKRGGTPVWGTVGREPSQRSSTRHTNRSSTSRFHDGPWRRTTAGVRAGRRLRENGWSWAHHTATEGRCPSRSTASRAWRRASDTTLRFIRPRIGKSCHISMPSSSAASYSSGRAM